MSPNIQECSLIYSIVAHDTTILGEWSMRFGNFVAVLRMLLPSLPRNPQCLSYKYDQYVIHQWCYKKGLRFIVLCPDTTPYILAYNFLQDVAHRVEKYFFSNTFNNSIALSLNHVISPLLQQRMHHWDTVIRCKLPLSVQKIRNQIHDIRNIMVANIDELLAREEKISLLVERTEEMSHDASQLQRRAKRFYRNVWWKHYRWILIFFIFFAVGLIF